MSSSLQDIHNVAVKGISKLLQDFGVLRSSNLEYAVKGVFDVEPLLSKSYILNISLILSLFCFLFIVDMSLHRIG